MATFERPQDPQFDQGQPLSTLFAYAVCVCALPRRSAFPRVALPCRSAASGVQVPLVSKRCLTAEISGMVMDTTRRCGFAGITSYPVPRARGPWRCGPGPTVRPRAPAGARGGPRPPTPDRADPEGPRAPRLTCAQSVCHAGRPRPAPCIKFSRPSTSFRTYEYYKGG